MTGRRIEKISTIRPRNVCLSFSSTSTVDRSECSVVQMPKLVNFRMGSVMPSARQTLAVRMVSERKKRLPLSHMTCTLVFLSRRSGRLKYGAVEPSSAWGKIETCYVKPPAHLLASDGLAEQ